MRGNENMFALFMVIGNCTVTEGAEIFFRE